MTKDVSFVAPPHTTTICPSWTKSGLVFVLRVTSMVPMGMGGGSSHSAGVKIARLGLLCVRIQMSALRIHSPFGNYSVSPMGPSAPLFGEERGPDDEPPPGPIAPPRSSRYQPGSVVSCCRQCTNLFQCYVVPAGEQCIAPGRAMVSHNALHVLGQPKRRNASAPWCTSPRR